MPLREHEIHDGRLRILWRLEDDPATVWHRLTDADRLPDWLGTRVDGSFTPGDALIVDHGDGCESRSRIGRLEEGRALAMTWEFPDEPASRVAFALTPAAAGGDAPAGSSATDLELVHDELGDLVESYRPGWITHLTYLEASLRGAPLPTSAFWDLYATHARLTAG